MLSNTETTINDNPIPKWSATKPKTSARTEVNIVLNNDCADKTEVKISFGTLSET